MKTESFFRWTLCALSLIAILSLGTDWQTNTSNSTNTDQAALVFDDSGNHQTTIAIAQENATANAETATFQTEAANNNYLCGKTFATSATPGDHANNNLKTTGDIVQHAEGNTQTDQHAVFAVLLTRPVVSDCLFSAVTLKSHYDATSSGGFTSALSTNNYQTATSFLPHLSQVIASSTHATTPWTQTSRTEIVSTSTGDASDHASFHDSAVTTS